MERINRPAAPAFLAANYKRWSWQWKYLRIANPQANFNWYQHNHQPVNQLLLPSLQAMTNFHCSFCDQKNLEDGVIEPTVEHFKPKSAFPLLSYVWGNLFLCCGSCQKKYERYTTDLLKPDRATYNFDDYFVIDWTTGKLEPLHTAPDPRYYAAFNTIDLYGLNRGGKPKARLKELDQYNDSGNPNIDDFSYRFFITRA